MPKTRSWFRIENAASEEADVFIYDQIAWFGVSADEFVKDLNKITAKTINLRINSPGGNVFDGVAIYNALRRHAAKVVTHIDGMAASIASVIALAGDEIRMADGAFLMIHNPFAAAIGDSTELRRIADLLDKVAEASILSAYQRKTGVDKKQLQQWMDDETWFNADEAKEHGFVDVIEDQVDANAAFELVDIGGFRYQRVPEQIAARARQGNPQPPETEREFEAFLRDAGGFSRAAASAIASRGFKARSEPRDEDDALLAEIAATAERNARVLENLTHSRSA